MIESKLILIADDDKAICTVLQQALERAGYEVRATGNAATLWKWIEQGDGDLVIIDVIMPDENGLDLVPRIKKLRPHLRTIVMSAQNTLLTAVEAARCGAFEYLPKPFDLKELLIVVERAFEAPAKNRSAEFPIDRDDRLLLIGRSPAMQNVYRTMARLVNTDLTVMINGESGTGKELVARALHDFGPRRNRPFVAVNMASIPRDLIESDLFGHEKGAFTGATARGIGRFEQAEGGTLFLDEIGDMPLEAQTRLLRVLQDGKYTAVGGQAPIRSNVRIIAATHRNLTRMIRQGLFREDLFYRLNVVPICLPSLKERSEDIPELTRHFLAKIADEGLPNKTINPIAIDRLQQYHWPGNVRELENLMRRLVALYPQDTIDLDVIETELASAPHDVLQSPSILEGEGLSQSVERHLQEYFKTHGNELPNSGLYDRILREIEKPLIKLTLKATRGNQVKAAQILGLNRNTLRKKIHSLNITIVRGENA